jgi:uncharacterized protein YecE (DUF72 family)
MIASIASPKIATVPLLLVVPKRVLSSAMGPTSYRVGCASWLDTSLLADGSFYPAPNMTAEARLRWYARFFEAVEVNATYYALPAYDTSRAWVERTPPGFQFAVKAYALMTGHHPKAQALVKELRTLLPRDAPVNARGEVERKHFPAEALDLCFGWFRDALAPLAQAGKLGYVLFQLAPWIGYSAKALEYLGSLPERLPGWTLAVEFRNPSWIPRRTAEVLKFLRDQGLSYVAVDCPWQPLIATATTDSAVMRLHGRNVEGWRAQTRGQHPSVAEKYDYLYRPEELTALSETARRLEEEAATVRITFNNNNRDYPVRNGLQFRRLLGQSPPDLEASTAEFLGAQRPSARARRSPR